MHLDPYMMSFVSSVLVILAIVAIVRRLKQPYVVGYLVAGILLGPHVLGVVEDQQMMTRFGEIGVVFLLFFIGMEVSPRQLVENWRVSVIGTLFQIIASVGLIALIGWWLEWPTARIVLLGFVISLSSTAVVLNMLQERGELKARVGQDALAILLAQDLAIIPMLIIIGMMGGAKLETHTIWLQVIGGIGALGILFWLTRGRRFHLPFAKYLRADHELQVFAALAICLGLALVSGLLQLSTALGAFMAGMMVGAARETDWIHHRLEPFRIIFVAVFFISIGMLVNLDFVVEHLGNIALIVIAVFLSNTFINVITFKLLGDDWPHSLYAGAILAQIGEFSFVLAAVAFKSGLVTDYAYQTTVAVIALTLLLCPFWAGLFRYLVRNHYDADQSQAVVKLNSA